MIEKTITTTELAALYEAFKGWTWSVNSIEPDVRIQVLIEEPASETRFLVRHQHGWLWATDAYNAVARSKGETTLSWNYSVDGIDGELRIPTAEELIAGGWEIIDSDDTEDETPQLPFATEQLAQAAELLEKSADMNVAISMRAQAMAMASIAATVHDLAGLLEDELTWRRSQRPATGSEVEEGSEEQDSAHRSKGPGEDPNFSFSGR